MSYEFRSIYFDDPLREGRVLDVFAPAGRAREVALLFVHGGGWCGGSRTGNHAIMRAFTAKGFWCAATDYRLTGVTIRDQIMDVRHGYDVFVRQLREHGHPPRVVLFGGSAGAHLAALVTLTRPGQCGEPTRFEQYQLRRPWLPPAGAALQSTPLTFEPWPDIFPGIWSAMQDIVGRPYRTHPALYRRVSPVRYLSRQSPPLFFLEAEHEHMFPREQTVACVRRLRAWGRIAKYRVYHRAEHGFFYDITRRPQREACRDLLAFFEAIAVCPPATRRPFPSKRTESKPPPMSPRPTGGLSGWRCPSPVSRREAWPPAANST